MIYVAGASFAAYKTVHLHVHDLHVKTSYSTQHNSCRFPTIPPRAPRSKQDSLGGGRPLSWLGGRNLRERIGWDRLLSQAHLAHARIVPRIVLLYHGPEREQNQRRNHSAGRRPAMMASQRRRSDRPHQRLSYGQIFTGVERLKYRATNFLRAPDQMGSDWGGGEGRGLRMMWVRRGRRNEKCMCRPWYSDTSGSTSVCSPCVGALQKTIAAMLKYHSMPRRTKLLFRTRCKWTAVAANTFPWVIANSTNRRGRRTAHQPFGCEQFDLKIAGAGLTRKFLCATIFAKK